MTEFLKSVSEWAIPLLIVSIPAYAAIRHRIPVYEEFVSGAKEGFDVAVRIIPYLVAMLVAIGMFRASGAMDLISEWTGPFLDRIGFPADLLPLALMRPLSGSGSLALFSDLIKEFGPDSLIVKMAATIMGSTETTFYVIAVYFGSVGIRKFRHAIPAGLLADLAGIIASIFICRIVFG
ncbi:MAG: spore maturation protein [Bacteroidetes bacterium]|nr:spore maturation protein [Bacteroidota bacterium]